MLHDAGFVAIVWLNSDFRNTLFHYRLVLTQCSIFWQSLLVAAFTAPLFYFQETSTMSQAPKDTRTVVSGVQKMTPSEAFVETMVANGVTDIFGIMGSAFMDAMDIFAPAGIRLVPVVHEQGGAHMADG